MDLLRQQFPQGDFALLGLVLLLPLFGALVNGIFGKRLGKDAVRLMALVVIGGSFALSVVTFFMVAGAPVPEAGGGAKLSWTAWEWFSVTGRNRTAVGIDVKFSVDVLSATMMLVVTGVGWLIHLYSTGYMDKDPSYHRFFAYLNLFIFSMLVLILGDNLAVLFVGWEGVGLCSYLLIGFWFDDEAKAAAGKKAFIANRIGDFGLLVAMAMLVWHAGTLSWTGLEQKAVGFTNTVTVWPISNLHASALPGFIADILTPDAPFTVSVSTLIALALFLGCCGKSAQFPLYVWLPDAMAGPTPVSALIHAATMVTAGVYLVARTSFIFAMSPAAMAIVASIGAFTALFAATIAFAQNDLKKVLAYSTVSQLGFMFIGVGVGAFTAGFFHVITHAFFKGCLFLCAGSVIHAMHARIHDDDASQDMRNMGGLRKYMPWTHLTFLVSCFAIAGAPPLSGFWSKDEILYKAFVNNVAVANPNAWVPWPWFGKLIYVVGLVAAICTAFYMFRAYFMTFWGDFRGWKIVRGFKAAAASDHDGDDHQHPHGDELLEGGKPHESPPSMTIPLMVLAGLAAVAGFMNMEPLHIVPLEHFLSPVFRTASKSVTAVEGAEAWLWPLAGVGTLAFAAGAGAAYWVYVLQRGKPAANFVASWPKLHQLIYDKWRIDELYEVSVLGMIDAMGDTAAQFDKWVIDGIIAKVTAGVIEAFGIVLRTLQTGRVQVYAAGMVIGTAVLGWFVFTPQANAEIDNSNLNASGAVVFTAAPGHGYKFRWRLDGADPPTEFSAKPDFNMSLRPCEEKTAVLEVQNVLGAVAESSFTSCRFVENRRACCLPAAELPGASAAPGADASDADGVELKPGKHDAGIIDGILRGRTRPKARPAAPGGKR